MMAEENRQAGCEETHVMLVDDHDSYRQPLAFMLEREPDLKVVAEAGSLAEAREVLEAAESDHRVDLVMVDLDLPDGSGAEFILEMRASSPRSPALVLSAYSDRVRLAQAIEAGAAGILHKSSRLEEILEAARRVRSGEQLIPPQEVAQAVRVADHERLREQEAALWLGKLTPRERDLLKALADGSSDKEVAERLYIGVGTVRSHMTRLLSKLEADSRLQALVFAIRHGLIEVGRP